jgi:gingipain R
VRKVIVTTILIFIASLSAAGQPPDVKILQDRGSSILVEFRLNGYDLVPVTIDGKEYFRIEIPGVPNYLEAGNPDLPMINRSVIIPDQGTMGFRIKEIEQETRSALPIVPSKGNLYRNVDPQTIPYRFNDFYQTDAWWPNQNVTLEGTFILRDYRGLSIRFNPFHYNPIRQELKVIKRIVMEVYVAGPGGENPVTRVRQGLNREFLPIYENVFLNFSGTRYDSISERPGRMLIITANAYNANLQSFLKWKTKKGIYTKIVNISTIGNSQTAIKNRIQAEDDSTDLTWVLLVGDSSEVFPARGTSGGAAGYSADPVYTYTRGSDSYSDLFISRMSSRGGTAANIDKQVSRTLGYERTPLADTAWYRWGLGVASNQSGGSPSYCDSTRVNWLRDSLRTPKYTYFKISKSYDSWGTADTIRKRIEEGTTIINYIGHGSVTGWSNGGGFNITNINALNNPWKLPCVLSVACVVGQFSSDCYCEASVTAGEVNQPDGFLAHWGSSINQSWEPPCWGQSGAVNLLSHNLKNTFGGMCFNGASYMIEHYGATSYEGIEMAQTWHIFGDASVQIRTLKPDSMIATHNSTIPLGDKSSFTVTVKDNDGVTLIPDALVCCWIYTQTPQAYATAYTNASGIATLTLTPQTTGDTMWVTITKFNYKPYEGYALVGPVAVAEEGKDIRAISLTVNPSFGHGRLNISYRLGQGAESKELKIYDLAGVLVKSFTLSPMPLTQRVMWNGDDEAGRPVASGVYFVKLTVDDRALVKKAILLR